MKKILITIVAFGSLLLAGCEANEIPGTPYDGPDYVYFEITTTNTVEVLFKPVSTGDRDTIITRNVLVAGKLDEDRDRTFKVTVEMAPGSEQYDLSKLITLDKDTYTIGKGKMTESVNFTLHNNVDYLKQFLGRDIYAILKIVPTDDFSGNFIYQSLSIHFWISSTEYI